MFQTSSPAVTGDFPTIHSLGSKDDVPPRPRDDFCDNPCDDLFMYGFETQKSSREVVTVFVGGF